MSGLLAFLVKAAGSPLRFKLVGRENLPGKGPAIVIANHLGEVGPIAMMITFPIRLYPWIITDMMEAEKAPEYLYQDFIEPVWKLHGRLGRLTAKVVGRIAVWLLNGLDGIPVNTQVTSIRQAFTRSIQLLLDGKWLLIFPEKPLEKPDPVTGIRPLSTGYTWLCQIYRRKTGKGLPVIPTLVHAKSKQILIGEPIELAFTSSPRQDLIQARYPIEEEMQKLYFKAENRQAD
ncbi:MAG TPA: hypothetical protein PLI60_07200 [Anaerolineaceae bacterium]|nr:hypothetical protein [Anaerolineaceae bacterium]